MYISFSNQEDKGESYISTIFSALKSPSGIKNSLVKAFFSPLIFALMQLIILLRSIFILINLFKKSSSASIISTSLILLNNIMYLSLSKTKSIISGFLNLLYSEQVFLIRNSKESGISSYFSSLIAKLSFSKSMVPIGETNLPENSFFKYFDFISILIL
ncbi:hypothetical protein ES708_21946 [subsurface metagenome]